MAWMQVKLSPGAEGEGPKPKVALNPNPNTNSNPNTNAQPEHGAEAYACPNCCDLTQR